MDKEPEELRIDPDCCNLQDCSLKPSHDAKKSNFSAAGSPATLFQQEHPAWYDRLVKASDPVAEWCKLKDEHAALLDGVAAAGGHQLLVDEDIAAQLCARSGAAMRSLSDRFFNMYTKLSKMEGSEPLEIAKLLHEHGVWSYGSSRPKLAEDLLEKMAKASASEDITASEVDAVACCLSSPAVIAAAAVSVLILVYVPWKIIEKLEKQPAAVYCTIVNRTNEDFSSDVLSIHGYGDITCYPKQPLRRSVSKPCKTGKRGTTRTYTLAAADIFVAQKHPRAVTKGVQAGMSLHCQHGALAAGFRVPMTFIGGHSGVCADESVDPRVVAIAVGHHRHMEASSGLTYPVGRKCLRPVYNKICMHVALDSRHLGSRCATISLQY